MITHPSLFYKYGFFLFQVIEKLGFFFFLTLIHLITEMCEFCVVTFIPTGLILTQTDHTLYVYSLVATILSIFFLLVFLYLLSD